MDVKTCVVIGHFTLGSAEGKIFESAEFGYSCKYATAHEFISEVTNMHRKAGSDWTIKQVVIG